MAAPNEYYTSWVIGDDTTGNGSSGLPWKTIQKALDTITRDASDGDRVNIQDGGTNDISGAALTLATYGTPTVAAPLILQGYTTAAGDGGIAIVDGGSSVTFWAATTYDNLWHVNIKFSNMTTQCVRVDNNCYFLGCEGTGSADGFQGDLAMVVMDCYMHGLTATGIDIGSGLTAYNYITGSSGDINEAIAHKGSLGGTTSMHDIIDIDGSSDGIKAIDGSVVTHCSIFSAAGSGSGITAFSGDETITAITNNIIEGFSDGGVGVDLATSRVLYYGGNILFSNGTPRDILSQLRNFGDTDASASPFVDAASQDFRIVTTHATGAVQPTAFKQLGDVMYSVPGALPRRPGSGGRVTGALVRT